MRQYLGSNAPAFSRAIRIGYTTGSKWAAARVSYLDKNDHVRGVSAWLVRKGQTLKSKSGCDWEDISLTPDAAVYGKGSKLQNEKREDDLINGCCGVSFEFSKPRFLQPLPNGLTIARLDVMTHAAIPTFAAKDRKLPVKLKPLAQREGVVLELPAGFTIEELPKAVTVESLYGRYHRSYESRGTSVVFIRQLELKPQIVPSSDYANLRSFFSDVGKAQRAAVLLKRGA